MYCRKVYEARRGFLCETCRKDRWYEERYPDFVIKLSKKNISNLKETREISFLKATYWKHRFERRFSNKGVLQVTFKSVVETIVVDCTLSENKEEYVLFLTKP